MSEIDILQPHEFYPPPGRDDNLYLDKPPALEPDYYCRSRHLIRRGPNKGKYKYCYSRAGTGTNHKGFGRCHLHGGAIPAVEHRYAQLANEDLASRIAKYRSDPTILDSRDELAVARALLETYLDEYEDLNEALLAWYASFDRSKRDLHDDPLYSLSVIKVLLRRIQDTGLDVKNIPKDALQDLLESCVEQRHEEWQADMRKRKVMNPEPILRLDKPKKVNDIMSLMRALKMITEISTTIMKYEQEAHLSVYNFEMLVMTYGEITKKVLLKLLGDKVDEGEVNKALAKIADEWERVPLTQSSVARLEATKRELLESTQRRV